MTAGTGERLDAALAARGLAASRTRAARLISAGAVLVDGAPIRKPSARVGEEAVLEVAVPERYVGRAAHKLVAALDAFGLEAAGRLCLDAGASTGGFSQVLLERGAELVIAVDVGHGQLAPEVAADPRIRSFEGVNVRHLDRRGLAELTGSGARPDLVVADLSFISLTQVLPALAGIAADPADLVVLIKPQFEVGRAEIGTGVVRRAGLRRSAVERVLVSAEDAGLTVAGLNASPILGADGNHEYLAHLTSRPGADRPEWSSLLTKVVDA